MTKTSEFENDRKWKVEFYPRASFNGAYQIWDEEGNSPKDDDGMREYIENAVNRHEELLARVEKLEEALKSINHILIANRSITPLSIEQAIYNICEQALSTGTEGKE